MEKYSGIDQLNIPYTGSGARACQIGSEQIYVESELLGVRNFTRPPMMYSTAKNGYRKTSDYYQEATEKWASPWYTPGQPGTPLGSLS